MQFKDVVGQNELKEKLRTTVIGERISHAQIFEGPAGYGSFTLALAYAQFISCTNRNELDSCGECPSCKKYAKLVHPDLHSVFPVNTTKKVKEKPVSDDFIAEWRDIAVNRKYFTEQDWYESLGIEKQGNISAAEAEKIIVKLNFKPFESRVKIMLLWLPERMNNTASNRLLKLIEEPPPDTILLFVTEEPNKIMGTIYSRTQRIRLHPLDTGDIAATLKARGYSDEQVYTASRLSEGDYLKALQSLNMSQQTRENFNNFQTLMRLSFTNNIIALLDWAEEMAKEGRERQKNFFIFAEYMLRENFVMKQQNDNLLHLGFEEQAWSKNFSPYLPDNSVAGLYAAFNSALAHIAQNGNAKLIFTDTALKVKDILRKK